VGSLLRKYEENTFEKLFGRQKWSPAPRGRLKVSRPRNEPSARAANGKNLPWIEKVPEGRMG